MATYVYETIVKEGEETKQYEISHSMMDDALTKHPETGEPIERIILGGTGMMGGSKSEPAPSSGGCCGGGCGRAH